MAIQTKTFSVGDFAWQSWSNSYVLDLIITEVSTDIAANTSQVSYTLQLRSGANNKFAAYLGAIVQFNGNQIAGNASIGCDDYYNHTYTLLTGTTTVSHESDGTAVLNVRGEIWVSASASTWSPPKMEVTGSITLTQIPRVSSPTVSPGTVAVPGGVLTIRTNRKSNSFTHTLRYGFGNKSGIIATDVGDSVEWEVPESLANQIQETNTGVGTIECQTYAGGTRIGKDNVNFSVIVPQNDTTRPQLNPTATLINGFNGMYIQGKSRVKVQVNPTAWYSSIDSCGAAVEGLWYSGYEFTSEVLLRSGEQAINCSATDKRGYSNAKNISITVQAYGKPAVADVTCCRCDAEGNPDIYGRKILLKARRSWYSLGGKNLCLLRYRIRQENGAWSGYTTLLERGGSDNSVELILQEEAEPKFSYQVELSAADDLGETGVRLQTISTANTPLHLGKGGRNLGLGRYCDYSREDAIDVGWPMYMDSNRILKLPAPQEGDEAANKSYVDGRSLQEYQAVTNDDTDYVSIALPERSAKRLLGVFSALGTNGANSNMLPEVFVLETGWQPENFRVTTIRGGALTVSYLDGVYRFGLPGHGWVRLWLKVLG